MENKEHFALRAGKKYGMIILGSMVYAMGIGLFLGPNNLAPGGMSGISIILSHISKLPTGTIYLLLNIPLMIWGAWKLGLKLMLTTMVATAGISVFSNVFEKMAPMTSEPLLAAIFGGVLAATGMGFVLKAGGTTGGTDVLVLILKGKYKHLKTSTLFLITDFMVVLCSILVFGNINSGLYALIGMVTLNRVLDIVLYGSDSAKLIYIVTNNEGPVGERILNELGIGFTYVKGIGAYHAMDKNIILCAVKKQMYPKVRDIVQQEDPSAFLIVSWATDVYGKGFKNMQAKEL